MERDVGFDHLPPVSPRCGLGHVMEGSLQLLQIPHGYRNQHLGSSSFDDPPRGVDIAHVGCGQPRHFHTPVQRMGEQSLTRQDSQSLAHSRARDASSGTQIDVAHRRSGRDGAREEVLAQRVRHPLRRAHALDLQ